ncbi:hypothetical protein ACIBG8_43005 [Nonomuraea sp. NPDC050556]|uniref:hypothetical protein n=1 Tax=Nonomuraea sp. NPDC050556 TaxID=3364369 RepID=UPI0037AD8CD0
MATFFIELVEVVPDVIMVPPGGVLSATFRVVTTGGSKVAGLLIDPTAEPDEVDFDKSQVRLDVRNQRLWELTYPFESADPVGAWHLVVIAETRTRVRETAVLRFGVGRTTQPGQHDISLRTNVNTGVAVERGDVVDFDGTLRTGDGTTWSAFDGQTVVLQFRETGTVVWEETGTSQTGPNGDLHFKQVMELGGDWRAVFDPPGSPFGARSDPIHIRVNVGLPTGLEFSKYTVKPGKVKRGDTIHHRSKLVPKRKLTSVPLVGRNDVIEVSFQASGREKGNPILRGVKDGGVIEFNTQTKKVSGVWHMKVVYINGVDPIGAVTSNKVSVKKK